LLSGTVFFTLVEGWSILDSFYFSVTTLTTVGFGDPAPATAAGKIFTILYLFVGLGVIGGFINVLAKHTFARRMRGTSASAAKEGEGELERLAQLRDQGIITNEDFEAKKKQILGI